MKLTRTAMVLVLMVSGAAVHADIRLVGKTFTHAWTINDFPDNGPPPEYETRFCDEDTLVWNDVTDPATITSGTEHYELTELEPGILQISWQEHPATNHHAVVWTLNFRTYGIYGVLVNIDPAVNFLVAGGFSYRDGVEVEPPLRGCP